MGKELIPGKRLPRGRRGTGEKVGEQLVVTADITPGPGALQDIIIGGNPEAGTEVIGTKKPAVPLSELPTAIRTPAPDEEPQAMPDADEISTEHTPVRPLTFHAADVVPAPVDPTNADGVVAASDTIIVHDSEGGVFSPVSDDTKGEYRAADDKVDVYTHGTDAAAEANRAAIVAAGEAAQSEPVISDDEFAAELAAAEDADAHTLATSIDDLATAPTVPVPQPPAFSPIPSPISRPVPPPEFGRRVVQPAEVAPDISAPEAAAKKGVDAVNAVTERRGKGRSGRFMAFAATVGALAMAAWGYIEHKNAPDQEPAPDLASQTDNGAHVDGSHGIESASTPAAAIESVVKPIGAGEGSSQALAHMGLDNAHIQHALDLPVHIGNVTVPVRDTFVTAKPGELSLTADWNGDQVTGVHYSVGGHELSAQELSKYLVASHAQPQEHAPTVASVNHLDSTPVLNVSIDDARVQTILDSIHAAPLATHEPDMPRVATSHAPMPGAVVPMSTLAADYGKVIIDGGDLPIKIQRHVSAEAPTQLMPDRPADIRAAEAPTERVETPISDYPTQMAALDTLLKGEKDHTLELATNHFEFRKRGDQYEVRYTRCKTFDLLTPELMTNLERTAHLDFEHPMGVMALTQEEYASILPDGHPYKELVRQTLQMQIDMSQGMGLQNLVAEKNLRLLNGESEPEPVANQAGQQ